jgi:D-alanyl-D-alanine dipeptidase
MFKIIYLFILLSTIITANEQIILVISKDFDASKAQLYTFEKKDTHYQKVFTPFSVNLGRNGLAWGEGIKAIEHKKNEPQKREGDGRAPSGIFSLGEAFGYTKNLTTKLHYIYADKELICVDDISHKRYNQVLHVSNKNDIKSYENMRRSDNLYEIGVIVKHNEKNIPSFGSCIFLHVEKNALSPTSGCTSMPKKKLSQLIQWLDAKKSPILIQVPQQYYPDILEIYPELLIK